MSTTRTASHQLGDGFALAGVLLLGGGAYLAARVLGAVPSEVADAVGSTWPLALVAAGLVWALRGTRAAGLIVTALGAALTALINLPASAVLPAVLVVLGATLILGGGTGRRFGPAGAEVAAFSDLDRSLEAGMPHGLLAVFGDVRGTFVGDRPLGGAPVRAMAVFGSVRLEVPHGVAVDVDQTAVFGDVRAPEALDAPATDRVSVRALAIFGDVRIARA